MKRLTGFTVSCHWRRYKQILKERPVLGHADVLAFVPRANDREIYCLFQPVEQLLNWAFEEVEHSDLTF